MKKARFDSPPMVEDRYIEWIEPEPELVESFKRAILHHRAHNQQPSLISYRARQRELQNFLDLTSTTLQGQKKLPDSQSG